MADTLTRLAGPISPAKTDAGTTAYTPVKGIVAVKNIMFSNTSPLIGGWVYASLNAMTTPANRLVSGLYVPPGQTIVVPLDTIMNAGTDDLRIRQVVDMSYSNLTVATAVAVISSTTDGTTFATASWAAVAGTCYLMTVVGTHATAAAKPTSFTESAGHEGISWTEVQSVGTTTMNLSQWRAQATGTTAGTTTANFAATMTGCHIVIAAITGGDTSGTNGSAAIQTGGIAVGKTATETAIVSLSDTMLGARFHSVTSNAGSTATAGTGFTELSDAAIATPTNMLSTDYAITPGAVGNSTLNTTSTDKIWSIVGLQDSKQVINATVNGVVVLQ